MATRVRRPGAVRTVSVTETYKVPDYLSNVRRGLRVLDAKLGREWPKKIDPKSLDLGDGMTCVVGQLAINAMLNGPLDGYHEGIKKLPAEVQRDPWRFGFELPPYAEDQIRDLAGKDIHHPWWPLLAGPNTNAANSDAAAVAWDYLTAIWRQVLKERVDHLRAVARAQRQAKKATAPRKITPAKKTVAKKTTARKTAVKKTTARSR